MKKVFYLLLTLSLSLGFVGCGNDDDENGNENGTFKWEGDIENYNPLEGLWVSVNNPDRGLQFSSDRIYYVIEFKSGEIDNRINLGPFEINYKAYKYGSTSIRRYKLEGDRLTMYPNKNDNDNPIVHAKIK